VPHAGAFLEFETLRHAVKEEVVVKLTAQVALSMLKAKDVVATCMYLANSARVETNLTLCSLTVITGSGESSEISCSPAMLEAAKHELEQSIPQANPKAGPNPMRVTITSCMANPVGTSEMTARALTELVDQQEFTTGKLNARLRARTLM
jgi:hypothetical protein